MSLAAFLAVSPRAAARLVTIILYEDCESARSSRFSSSSMGSGPLYELAPMFLAGL